MFCVHLPVAKERAAIFNVHLSKLKGKKCYREMDAKVLNELAKKTEGYCGADIEAVVKDAVEVCFGQSLSLTKEALLQSITDTIPISMYCKDEIEQLKVLLSNSTFRNALNGKVGSE